MSGIERVGRLLRPIRAGARRSRLATLPSVLAVILSSPAFADGAAMPAEYAGDGVGGNVSPPLRWDGVPAATAALVLVIDDVDVPLPRPLIHTVAVLPAGIDDLDEGALGAGAPGVRFLRTVLGRGYHGPRPIPGHGTHHYRFHVFALDAPVADDVTSVHALRTGMKRSLIARGLLTGTYRR